MRNLVKTASYDEEKLEYIREAITNLNEFIKYKSN